MVTKSRQEMKAETYEKLFQAGIELIAKKGLEKTRPQAIAKLAGVSVGSFYSHFNNKYELMSEIALSFAQELTTYVAGVLADSQFDSLEEIVHIHFTAILDFYEGHPEWTKAQFNCRGAHSREILIQFRETTREHVDRLFDKYSYRTDLRRDVVIQAEMGMINYVLEWWNLDNEKIKKEDLVNILVKIALEGIYLENPELQKNS